MVGVPGTGEEGEGVGEFWGGKQFGNANLHPV